MRTGFISRILGKQAKLDKEILLDCLLEVAEERDLLNLIFDGMTEGVLVFDEAEILRFANRRAGELLAFTAADSLRRPMESFLRDPEIAEPIRRCLRTGEPVKGAEAVLLDSAPRALRMEIVPLYDERGRFGGALVMVLEVTEQKKREAELRETKRLATLATLSASLAHEIRNPLNSMGIHVQLLERLLRKQGAADLLKTTTIIREEIANLNERLTRFLDAARPRQPQFETVSVHELLEEVLKLLAPELELAGVKTEYFPPPVYISLFGDRIDLRRAFVNIVKNAIEAMPEGGDLIIRAKVESDTLIVEFEDTGAGISAAVLDRILEIGFTTKNTGSGLGLAQVDRCIREHSGELHISARKGGGTRIQIRLPVLKQGRRLLGMGSVPANVGGRE
jgi:signal transduction histidine kinase